ncbi:MAG: bactofilin family protein [Bacteroidales bacterium]
MFKREEKTVGMPHNAFAVGTTIDGNICADEDIRIDGTLNGNIICSGKVVIGPQATVNGNIESSTADIMGRIVGNISIKETLTIRSSGVIDGDITTPQLAVEPNAKFSGKCSMAQ